MAGPGSLVDRCHWNGQAGWVASRTSASGSRSSSSSMSWLTVSLSEPKYTGPPGERVGGRRWSGWRSRRRVAGSAWDRSHGWDLARTVPARRGPGRRGTRRHVQVAVGAARVGRHGHGLVLVQGHAALVGPAELAARKQLLGGLLWGVADVVVEVVEELMAAVVGADRVGAVPDLVDPAVGVDDPAGAPGGL